MKPVVLFARNMLELALAVIRMRAAASEAISATGAAKITVEPAEPGVVHVEQRTPRPESANWKPIAARSDA